MTLMLHDYTDCSIIMNDQEQLIGLPNDWPFNAHELVMVQPYTNGQINETEERPKSEIIEVLATIKAGVLDEDWDEDCYDHYQELKLRIVSTEQPVAVDIMWYGSADPDDNASKYLQQI